jgi:curved DNA-binding protein CbpA
MRSDLRGPSAYEILGVPEDASSVAVKAAWRDQAKRHHPDNGTHPDPEAMARINEAYALLSDPDRRDRYDQERAAPEVIEEEIIPTSGEDGWGDDIVVRPPPPARVQDRSVAHHPALAGAVSLAEAIRSGRPLPVQPTALVLGAGEVHHCAGSARLAAFYGLEVVGGDGGTFLFGSTWKGLLATGLLSSWWNRRRQRKAEREAAARWRDLGVVPVHVTNQRLLVLVEGRLESYWFDGGIVAFEPHFDAGCMLIHPDGGSPLRFDGPDVPYLAVVLHVLLRGDVPALAATP